MAEIKLPALLQNHWTWRPPQPLLSLSLCFFHFQRRQLTPLSGWSAAETPFRPSSNVTSSETTFRVVRAWRPPPSTPSMWQLSTHISWVCGQRRGGSGTLWNGRVWPSPAIQGSAAYAAFSEGWREGGNRVSGTEGPRGDGETSPYPGVTECWSYAALEEPPFCLSWWVSGERLGLQTGPQQHPGPAHQTSTVRHSCCGSVNFSLGWHRGACPPPA